MIRIFFFENYKFSVGGIRRGEQVRMISSGFLHKDEKHLFFNMLTLYFFAGNVIAAFGQMQFLLIYFASLLAGNLLAYYFNKNNYHYSAVGASGAVTGILYSAILLRPEMSLYLIFIPAPIPAYVVGIGYLLYSIYGMKSRNDNIGHDAHFGGAIGGFVLTLLLAPGLLESHPLMVGLLAIPIVILYFMHKTGKL